MAKKKKDFTEVDDLDGTVEGQAREFFEKEKAGYEERTGETVNYELPTPVTRTPIEVEPASETADAAAEEEQKAEGEAENNG